MPNRKPSRKRSFSERSYLLEVFRGLAVTGRHALRSLARPDSMITIDYPEVEKPMGPRFKGAHRLVSRPDGGLRCVACMCCPTVCPARCITIVPGEDPDDPEEKFPVSFQIDMLRCIYCGYCVEACPKDAIRMDTGIYEINGFSRQDFIHDRAYMVDLVKGARHEAAVHYRLHPETAPPGFQQELELPVDLSDLTAPRRRTREQFP